MKKDIPFDKVEGVALAVLPEPDGGEKEWSVYLINLQNKPLKNLMVTSKGYGEIENEHRETATLRKLFEEIPPQSVQKIEPIQEELFALTNEFWISFFVEDQVYDKKYIFVPESIQRMHFTKIPLLGELGVMIQ